MKYKDLKYEIQLGDRVRVFDHLLFKNDKETPLTQTMVWGTVINIYKDKEGRNVMDVRQDRIRFQHIGGELKYISCMHFITGRHDEAYK